MIKDNAIRLYNFFLDNLCSSFLPIKKQIFIDNFGGRGYGDNPKYIVDEIISRGLPYSIVWQVKEYDKSMPSAIIQVKKDTIRARCELFMSKVRIDNIKNGLTPRKKKNQYYIQTWHGYYGFKPAEQDAESRLSPDYVKQSKADSAITDVFISANSFFSDIIRNSFWKRPESIIFESGAPRNDLYFTMTLSKEKEIRSLLNIPQDTSILVYAPTFRDTNKGDIYYLDYEALHRCIEKKTNKKWVIVVRLHPNAISFAKNISFNDYVINGSSIADAQELFAISEALITDYSSVIGDFIIMNKPIFLYTPDLEEYVKNNRDLKPLFYKQPFKLCNDLSCLLNEVDNFDILEYKQKLIHFMSHFYKNFDDGHASAKVVDLIEKMMVDDF